MRRHLPALALSLCAGAGCSADQTAPGKAAAPGAEFQDCDECPLMLVVPAGAFTMGAAAEEENPGADEQPAHPVVMEQPFAVGKFEVTRGEYAAFVRDTGRSHDGGCYFRTGPTPENDPALNWRNTGYSQTDSHPVVCVSWTDARAYVAWLSEQTGKSYRLPSEAEWEYAARAGTTSARYWGSSEDDGCAYANGADRSGETDLAGWAIADCHDGHTYSAVVGSFKPNAFGLHDMLGNVAEWVADCWNDAYDGAPTDGSAWTSGDCSRPILRGASWHDDPRFLRSANRYGFYAAGPDSKNVRYRNFGFRVARTLD